METIRGRRKKYFSFVHFFHKTFAFSRKTSWVRTNTSYLLYCLQWFIQLRMFTMERFITVLFWTWTQYKEIKSVLNSRHDSSDLLKCLMWLNVLKQWHWGPNSIIINNDNIIKLILITLLIILLLIKKNSPEYERNMLHVKLFLPYRKRLRWANEQRRWF